MKKLIHIVFIILAIGLLAGCANSEPSINALTIGDIQTDPLSFTGEITITGVAAVISEADSTVFGVVDTEELLACKNLGCGAFMLPAKYVGNQPMPKVADEVYITGSWAEADDGYIFEVKNIDVKKNIMHLITN